MEAEGGADEGVERGAVPDAGADAGVGAADAFLASSIRAEESKVRG